MDGFETRKKENYSNISINLINMIRYLIVLFIISLFVGCSTTKDVDFIDAVNVDSIYKIRRVINVKPYYIIHAQRNDSTFKIISEIDNNLSSRCRKIKVGNKYILNLVKLFPLDSVFGKPIAPNLGIVDFELGHGRVVRIDKETHYKIYKATNLNGLYICP